MKKIKLSGRSGAQAQLQDNTDWQYYSLVSAAGKTVVGIYVGYNYNSRICAGNIQVRYL
jgi:hypothetical protein